MGRLINRERRERARQAKAERIVAIRRESVRSFVKHPYVEVDLDAIGRRAGVKKGVASMYFGSREELFIELIRTELEVWFAAVEEALEARREGRLARQRLARLLATSLSERPVLCRLLALAPVALEQNMEIIEAFRLHRWQLERMTELGATLERRCSAIRDGDGIRLLHRMLLLVAGVQPYADPRGSLAVNLLDPDFEALRVDLAEEIERSVLQSLGP
jgi:AcrR family transcriptional regulator